MKRSTFLKSLGALIAAPSVIAAAPPKEIKAPSVAKLKTDDYRLRCGDLVIFQDGSKAMVTQVIMDKPVFRSFDGKPINTNQPYRVGCSAVIEK